MKNNSQRSSVVNNPNNNTNSNIEFTKLQGFDVLEKLPEEKIIDNYNEQFYSTLSQLKFLSVTVPDEDKLLYHFEENENASVAATTGQMLQSFKDLFLENLRTKKLFKGIKKEVIDIFKGFENFDINITNDILPEIKKMENRLQKFLVEQKTENFKLIKEIAILQKDKDDLYNQIQICFSRLAKVEKDVGKKCKNLKKNNDKSFHMNQTQMNSTVSEKEYPNTKVQ
jgi:hypothetical protein